MHSINDRPIVRRLALGLTMACAAAFLALAMLACTPVAGDQGSPAVASPLTDIASAEPRLVRAEIIARFPHDPDAFTQGLLVDDGVMYESTGREGHSDVRRVEISSGRVLARQAIDSRQFGEGLARWRDRLISLTWTDGIAWQWQLPEISPRGSFRYEGEGWGLTASDRQLIQSDGSATLTFRNPETFAAERTITVHAGTRRFARLNELEYINGRIWANIWMTPYIAVIDPADGRVTHMVDARDLVAEVRVNDGDAVLNGIAYDQAKNRLYVTGKLWPTLYEIRMPTID